MKKDKDNFYQAGDGSWFYSAEDAETWDKIDILGQLNLLHVLKQEWKPEKDSQSKLRKLLEELNIDEFEDFLSDLLGIAESFETMVYEHEGNINLDPEYLERVYPEEKESLKRLRHQINIHKEWKSKHQASFAFLTEKMLEGMEEEND